MKYGISLLLLIALANCSSDKTAQDCFSQIYPVFQDGKWGGINNKGQEVIPLHYDWLYYNPIESPFLIVEKDTSKIIMTQKEAYIYVSKNYGERLFLSKDSFAVETSNHDTMWYGLAHIGHFCNTHTIKRHTPTPTWTFEEVCVYLGKDGKSSITKNFIRCSRFSKEGIALVLGSGFWGYIDTAGNFIWKQENPHIADYMHLMETPIENEVAFKAAYEKYSATRDMLTQFNLLLLNFESDLSQDFHFLRYRRSMEI